MIQKLKKFLSFLLIFLILFQISFEIPFGPFLRGTKAANTQYSDLVTVYVEDSVWNSGVRGVINRYANDISRNLQNTKVVLVPVPVGSSAFKIASINEKFYFEGQEGVRNLVGSVFIGDIPIPVIHDNDDFSRTVFPYVDFRDKVYIYNQISEKYEKNEKRLGEAKAEIWHGFISPNTDEYSKNEALINYFDKNHAFYSGDAPFDSLNGISPGNKDDILHPEYEPEIFYFDQKRESDALNYASYKGYLAYQNNKEDIIYNRFTKNLAESIQSQVLGKEQEDVEGLLEDVAASNGGAKAGQAAELIGAISEFDTIDSTGLSNPNVGDVQTRNVTLDVSKKFVESFAPGMVGEARTNVRNTGRYSNTGSSVNMDTIPFLISHLDSISDAFVKSVNTKLEGEIDGLVMTGGLSRNIAVPTKMAHLNTLDAGDPIGDPNYIAPLCTEKYREFTNFLDGRKANYINSAADCSTYLGNSLYSGQLVEAKRGLNVKHVAKTGEGKNVKSGNPTGDITEFLLFHGIAIDEGDSYTDGTNEMCPTNERLNTYGYWGGNTPLNLNIIDELPLDDNGALTATGVVGQLPIPEKFMELREGRDNGSSITALKDITGSELIENEADPEEVFEYPTIENEFFVNEENKNPHPFHCLNNNYILSRATGDMPIGYSGGLPYPEGTNLYLENMTYWNDEENVPVTEATPGLRVHDVLSPSNPYIVENSDESALFCLASYNLPLLDPNVELQPQIFGSGSAFIEGEIFGFDGEGLYSVPPITLYQPTMPFFSGAGFISSNLPVEGVDFLSTVDWGCDSRNIKLKNDFSFDYIYKTIHENPGNFCQYTNSYLFGNSQTFAPTITEEESAAFEANGTGVVIDPKYEQLAELAFSDATLSGSYLTGAYYEPQDSTGSLLVPQTRTGELVNAELVKSNIQIGVLDLNPPTNDEGDGEGACAAGVEIVNYFYKEIPSYIEHKSPNSTELYSQIKSKLSYNLPVDKDRYIDFVAANNTYQKIIYPLLFRLELPGLETVSGTLEEKLAIVDAELKNYLDEKSAEVNEVILNSDPSVLTDPLDIEIYEHLKVAEYSAEEVDLYQILKDIEPTEIESFLDLKEVTYYDFLVFSIYWNNLQSVPAKYKFIMEQYLSDQYKREDLKFMLPKNKKFYEMAYLGAPGTAQEMYVSLDPESKADNPFADEIYDNVELGSQLFASNVYENTGEGAGFKCAPPEGVPLWEWPSALSCWLEDFQNPGIFFNENACSQKTLFLTPAEQEEALQCQFDFNKNGVEDCVENAVPDGTISIYSDSPVYYYNGVGKITVTLSDANENPIKVDSSSRVDLELVRAESREGEVIEDISDYVQFNFSNTRLSFGETNFYFNSMDNDVDLYFKANLELKDSNGEIFASLESTELKVEVRADNLFATTYKLSEDSEDLGFQIGSESLIVSGETNIFVADEYNFPVAPREDEFRGASGAKEKLVMSLSSFDTDGENIPVNYPVSLKIHQGIDEIESDTEQLYAEFGIQNSGNLPIIGITEAGFYRFTFVDATGVEYSRVVQLIPDVAERVELDLSTNISETERVHTPHLVSLYDAYGNITSGDFYTISAEISGNGVTFDDLTKSKVFSTYEGFQAFKLISENSGGTSTIRMSIDGAEASKQFTVVENIDLEIIPQFDELIVGGGIYTYIARINGFANTGNIQTKLFVSAGEEYLTPLSPYFVIQDGEAVVKVITKKSSGRDVPIEFQAYGLRDSFRELQTIMHEVPIKIDISLTKDKIEASPESYSVLSVELKDRFGNIAFSDNSSGVALELEDKVSRFFRPEDIDTPAGEHLGGGGNESIIIEPDALEKTVVEGRVNFRLYGTEEPGLSYFKVLVPSIEGQSFVVNGQVPFSAEDLAIEGMLDAGNLTDLGSRFFDDLGNGEMRFRYLSIDDLVGSSDYRSLDPAIANRLNATFDLNNQMTITGVGHNAGMIETYYFWKQDKIKEKFYNALYTNMLGSDYGNIEERNYLAGGILFEKENRGLAVTSLLQNPYKTDGVFRIGKAGSLRKVASNEDLAQDVVPSLQLTDDSTKVTLYNQAINVNIGDIYYNFDPGLTEITVCEMGVDIKSCTIEDGPSQIIVQELSSLFNVIAKNEDILVLDASGEEILRIGPDGVIYKDLAVQTFVDFDSREKFLKIDVATVNGEAAIIYFHFNDETELRSTRNASQLGVLNSRGNSIVLHAKTNYYDTKILPDVGIEISYRDLFDVSKSLENFVEDTPYGYEGYLNESGIGFTGTNKSLLNFASGKSVGESTRNYHSFYMINLGDPVVSLKKIPKKIPFTETDRSFDSSLGSTITREDGIIDYSFFDYNNDGREDILLQKNDGYLKLLENVTGETKYMNRGNLIFAADISPSTVAQAGDFDGNGYGDVFIMNTKGQGAVYMNEEKKFTRFDLDDQFALNGKITQAEVFDMDANGQSDIVTLDESGQINIFYGGGSATAPAFTKRTIEEGVGATLLEDALTGGAALYYDGLQQSDSSTVFENLRSDSESDLQTQLELLNPTQEDSIDFAAYCQRVFSCSSRVNDQNGNLIPGRDPAGVCRADDECLQLAIDETVVNAINVGKSSGFISESELQAALFLDLPYSPLGNNREEVVEVGDISNNVSESFPEFNEATHPDVQAGVDITDAAVTEYILSSNSGSITYEGDLNQTDTTTFIRSEYAPQAGLEVKKFYTDGDGGYLKSGDNVEVRVVITNVSDEDKANISYVDNFPPGFILDKDADIISSIDGYDMMDGIGTFDYMFDGFSLAPGKEIRFIYALVAPPIKVGHMEVGIFEDAGGGSDGQGDVKIKKSETSCGEIETLYMSAGYGRSEEAPICDNTNISELLEEHLTDINENGVPDYIDELLENDDIRDEYAEEQLINLDFDSDLDGLPDRDDDSPNQNSEDTSFIDGLEALDERAAEASEQIDTIIQGLGCGFGGGGCIANPLNWAPLAPGNDPTLFGMPIGDGTRIGEGIPIFSALTGLPTPIGCIPMVWPVSPLNSGCSGLGAGGYLGVNSPSNFIRIFVTPTLTGAAGVAICFGGPASLAGRTNPPGIHPLVPGGNCIVAAMPLPMCSNDGSDGDPSFIGRPEASPDGAFSVIGGSCGTSVTHAQQINPEVVGAYLQAGGSEGFVDRLAALVENGEIASGDYWNTSNENNALIQGGQGGANFGLGFSVTGEDGFTFQDVEKISMKRVNSFPDFLAGWFDRQIAEISDKLTDFPGIYIILPDMSGFMQSGWGNFPDELQESFATGQNEFREEQLEVDDTIKRLDQQKKALDCSENLVKKSLRCHMIDIRISKLKRDSGAVGGVLSVAKPVEQKGKSYISGIKSAFDFLSSLPLISIESEKVLVAIPWADMATINRAVIDWKQTRKQWEREISGVSGQFQNIDQNFGANSSRLLSSLDRNIEVIEHYARLPEELNKLLRTKELRLEQITCNIDVVNEMLNGRIDRNGKRFKAWVELYVTIKAILKSWQLIMDIFYEYDAACHECKNERQDLYYFFFKLISIVIPEIPVIQFPRWPDVIIDLHNIRAGIVVNIPDIEIRPRPFILPPLPSLALPDFPNGTLTLPQLPLLEDYTIPELPELPSLPVVDLPDLPPPPKLPKLFAELEGMLSILKLITKVMCILKSSPFVPEWRAGDQIAFITERTGYLPTDFIDLTYPQFSYPFVDAIKVTSYVNFEYETDFLIEATRNTLLPFTRMTSDVSKKINRRIPDFNLDKYEVDDVNVSLDLQGNKLDDASFARIAGISASGIRSLLAHMETHAKDEVNAQYFTHLANENLNKKWIIRDPRFNELRSLWQSVQEYDYEEEEHFIEELKSRNEQKFDILQSIIENERQVNKKQIEEVNTENNFNFLGFHSPNKLIAGEENRFAMYEAQIDGINDISARKLLEMYEGGNEEKKSLQKIADKIAISVSKGVQIHKDQLARTNPKTLFADHNSSHGAAAAAGGTCAATHADKIDYEGIYIIEEGTPYRLFDYVEEIDGDEEHRYTDYDNDGDEDIVYMMNGVIYLKENLKTQSAGVYSPGVENSNFEEMDEKFEAINGFREVVESGYVNISFNAHSNRDVNAFRLEFYDRIDAFDSDEGQNPDTYQKIIIDAFARIDELTLENESDFYTLRKNVGRITRASIAPGLEVEADEILNIKDLIARDNLVQIGEKTKIYSGRGGGGFSYYYTSDDNKELRNYSLGAHSNVEFKDNIVIVGVSGDVYVKSKLRRTYRGSEIYDLSRYPFLENTIIRLEDEGRTASDGSNIEIVYYDGTELGIDFALFKKYELRDLGPEQEEYYIKTSMENAFYYARFTPFLANEFGTAVKTVLMSPQNEIDSLPPELDYGVFRIPVYKERVFDLTPHIYEDSGLRGIAEMYIDTDLDVDSDGNGDSADDRNISADGISLERSLTSVKLRFGPYDELFRKRFKVIMIDNNDNVGESILNMEVYAPIPDITYGDRTEVRGLLRENIDGEPISLFRYRGGALTRMRDIGGSDVAITGFNGEFKFNFPIPYEGGDDGGDDAANNGGDNGGGADNGDGGDSDGGGNTGDDGGDSGGDNDGGGNNGGGGDAGDNTLTIRDNETGDPIASINGDTGKMDIIDPLASVDVLASNDSNNTGEHPLFIVSKAGEEIYGQSIEIPGGYNQIVNNFENIDVEGTYLDILDEEVYGVFKIPDDAEFSAGTMVIYYLDDPYEPLFTITRDGKIIVKNEKYQLSYGSQDEYIIVALIDEERGKIVGELLLKPGEDFRLN